MTFTWTEELSVGVAELDEQHRHLFDIINKLLAVAGQEDGKEKVVLLGELTNYNLYHLDVEEEYMKKFECESETHVDAHSWYKVKSKELEQKAMAAINEGSDTAEHALRELATFAGDWHVGHITHMDKTYTQCFNEHGLH